MILIPHGSLSRLSRLSQACEQKSINNLNHIALSVVGDTARITATNGRILVCALFDAEGETDRQVVLDGAQFTLACKAALKSHAGMFQLLISAQEARFESDHGASLIRLIDGTYPTVDVILRKHAGKAWIPSVASIEPALLTAAQRIIGRPSIAMSTTVEPGSSLPVAWENHGGSPVTTYELGSATRAPSFWQEGRWMVLLMPNTRTLPERLDLRPFVLVPEVQAAVA